MDEKKRSGKFGRRVRRKLVTGEKLSRGESSRSLLEVARHVVAAELRS